MTPLAAPRHFHPIRYDARRRRVWILGQRCHHGATGALLAGVAAGGLAAAKLTARTSLAMCAAGSLLMAHDWNDRAVWFRRGPGS